LMRSLATGPRRVLAAALCGFLPLARGVQRLVLLPCL
jgi:hypothetical protein